MGNKKKEGTSKKRKHAKVLKDPGRGNTPMMVKGRGGGGKGEKKKMSVQRKTGITE